ncbi:hypothetical protein A1O1_02127 [Capronia coronata CBS 617.96]|uniref:CST complex subunit STN1 n=1 Tax=Capronia coronata CBS 617.96 TaxID=1182541 RepID=W9ZGU3_9EURO|nr:uncharacterized protein A1O1_02127 [Capronia coronata CBS 617.96]EXJ93734.1 hypothetical protein A1O1_02127 [Capronia coronata CBS 617.96]
MPQASRAECPSRNIVNDLSGSDSDSDLDTDTSADLAFYPAYTFQASATWFRWVKLTAHDIHCVLEPHHKYAADITTSSLGPGLPDHRGSGGGGRDDAPLLLFYLNHPIQFVQVIGVVVVVEEYFEKFWLFTVDDGSGATIDVRCRKPEKEDAREQNDVVNSTKSDKQSGSTRIPSNAGKEIRHDMLNAISNKDRDGHNITTTSTSSSADKSKSTIAHAQPQPQSQLDTADTDELTEDQILHKTVQALQIGTVVQAKGTISTFRSTRQLTLLRLTIVPDTTHEMALISSRTSFMKLTLCKPWVLSAADQKRLYREAQDDRQQGNRQAAKRRERRLKMEEREKRHARSIREQYEAEERQRAKAAEAARRAGVALQDDATTQ